MNERRFFFFGWVLCWLLFAFVACCLFSPSAFAEDTETDSLPASASLLEDSSIAPVSDSAVSASVSLPTVDFSSFSATEDTRPILSTALDTYTVTEGLLLILVVLAILLVLIKIFGF